VTEVVDINGRRFRRFGDGWMHVALIVDPATTKESEQWGSWTTEEKLLAQFGPVRCPVTETVLAHRAAARPS
jgi:hypothetical protein